MTAAFFRKIAFAALAFTLVLAVFGVVFFLYGLPMEPFWYAAGLCALGGAAVMGVHCIRVFRAHRLRRQALNDPELTIESLPEAKGLIEQDDRAIMLKMRLLLEEAQNRLAEGRQDSQEYFTLWVHQIKTPISVMRLKLQAEDTAANREMLNELISMEQYVEMALGYTRLNAGTKDLVIENVALDEVIRTVIRAFAPLMIAKRIPVRYAGTDRNAVSDARWLRFMLEQVMSNAVKYTPSGSITIEVMDGPVIEIIDTGIGIAPEDVPRVFEKGYTGYNGRAGRKSTGLGLYLLRRAADMLNHRVTLASEPGKGTRVTLDLTRAQMRME